MMSVGPGSTAWRLVLGPGGAGSGPPSLAASGAANMAVDQALLESVQQGGPPVLRLYSWRPACLSLGRNQPACGLYDAARLEAAGIDIVRRPTGGLAVLHDRELTYCVLAPLRLFGGPRAAYGAINAALVDGLRSMGIPAEQATGAKARGSLRQAEEPCFQVPANGEVVAHGRKLVGSAQRCERAALLQHGSILLAGSQARVRDLRARCPPSAPAVDGSITLEELTGREPGIDEVCAAVLRGFERLSGTPLAPAPLDQRENGRARELARWFGAGEWTWRR